MLTLEVIQQAQDFLRPRIRRTPLEFSPELSRLSGTDVFLKLENLQITGSFKVRGAFFKLSRLSQNERSKGVITASAGNHGKGVAYSGKELGIQTRVYVPKNVDESKLNGMLALGAEVIKSETNSFDETEAWAKEEAKKLGMCFVSAFEDSEVMAGNGGSLAAEIFEDLPQARTLFFPVSGGGLGAGLSFYFDKKSPQCHLVAVQHEHSPALKLSLEKGLAVTQMPGIDTLAGGIEGGIGAQNFSYLQNTVDEVALVSETEIKKGVVWMLEHHQYLIEPTAAVTLAALLNKRHKKLTGSIVVVLSGRNVSLRTLREILSHGF